MKKKAQIQGGETIAVVIVIIIIIAIAISFGTNRKLNSLETESKKLDYQNALRIALKVANLQEIKCSTANSIGNTCLDLFKIKSIGDIIKNDDQAYLQYQEIFQNTEITVQIIYPEPKTKYLIYNYSDSINKSKVSTYLPVLVLNPIEDTKSFAILDVATYS